MTHAGGGTQPPRAPLIGAEGLQPWPSGGFVGAQSATAPRPVTVTHTHTHRPWLIRLWLRLKAPAHGARNGVCSFWWHPRVSKDFALA